VNLGTASPSSRKRDRPCSALALTILIVTVAAPAQAVPPQEAAPSEGPISETWFDRVISENCPRAVASSKIQQRFADQRRASSIKAVTRPALQRELLLLAEQDQDARRFAISSDAGHSGKDVDMAYMNDVDSANLRRLKQIIRQGGFPTARMIGYNGMQAAWLLVQHADSDPAFQAQMLPVLTRRVHRGELDPQNYALLTDRVLLAQGKSQRYGTQFELREGVLTVRALDDPSHVDQRRRTLGLIPLQDYACILKATAEIRQSP
jgi:hypothetical protein